MAVESVPGYVALQGGGGWTTAYAEHSTSSSPLHPLAFESAQKWRSHRKMFKKQFDGE